MKSFFQFISESAAQQAARLGLEGDGHGGWYKDGEFVAKTEKGRLKFLEWLDSLPAADANRAMKEMYLYASSQNEKSSVHYKLS